MKDLLKKLGGIVGTEQVVDRAAEEIDKSYPGMSRKLLITLVSAAVGALTTWAFLIDGRVYDLREAVALRQTIVQNAVALEALEDRLERRSDEIDREIGELRQRYDILFCKVFDAECRYHGDKK